MSSTPTLLDLGPVAYSHQSQVDEVKRQIGVDHNYFDCWIFGFLENKNFKVDETVAKLNRRDEFERTELAEADITEWMMENMQKGIIQVIGNDKAGRVTFYICTGRDKPSSARREESKKNFDMFISYGTRLRPESKRCQMAMLINQDKASLWSNLDMTFQADIALRIAKYYPGCVDKMYICKMGRTLAALAKPIFSRLPSIVSDRIIIISDGDIKNGKLLELYDKEVLPVALGGENDCDKQENYTRFAYTIKDYFEQLRAAVRRGSSVKEWELNNLRAAGYADASSRMDALKRSFIDPGMSASRSYGAGATDLGAGGELPSISDGNPSWSAVSGSGGNHPQPHPRHNGDGEDDDNDDTLVTCDTVTLDLKRRSAAGQSVAGTEAGGGGQGHRQRVDNYLQEMPRDLFSDYVAQFSMIEGFFRINIAEMHEREWLSVLQREVEERQDIIRLEDHFQTESLFRAFPPAMQWIVRGFLWLCLMVMSSYFLMGTLFITLLGTVTLIFIFFAMFAHTYNVFLYGAALVVTGVQFSIFCSRGYDLTRNTFNGKLIQALKTFGNKALLFQVIIYVLGTIGYFVVFCVMAARRDVLTGLQYSIAYGWIAAVCLTVVYHFFFAFGFREISKTSYRHGSRMNNAETTLYLFMDVELDDDLGNGRSTTEVVVLTLIALLAFAAGVAYMVSGGEGIFFLAATVVLLPLLLVLCSVFMFSSNASSSSSVTFVAVLYACVFWANAVFTMTMHGWRDEWGESLLTVLFIMLFVCAMCFISIYGPWRGAGRRWLFRISWGLIVLHVLGCIIGLFVYNYRMGLFVLALTLHLLISCFRTNESSNSYGVFTIVVAFTAALLACCLLGNYAVGEVYGSSASATLFPNYSTQVAAVPSAGVAALGRGAFARLEQPVACAQTSALSNGMPFFDDMANSTTGSLVASALLPVCLMRFPDNKLDVMGLALFAKLGYNDNRVAQAADLAQWFPGFTRALSLGSDSKTSEAIMAATVFRKETAERNVTIVAVRTGRNVQRVIEAMTMWIDQYCISFFGFLMPKEYLESIIPYISFIESMTPQLWKSSVSSTMVHLNEYLARLSGPNEHIYVVGHGSIGAAAAIAVLQSNFPAKIVLFSAPEVIRSKNKLAFTEAELAGRLVNVRTTPSVFNSWYMHSPSDQTIPCNSGGKACDAIDTTITTLDRLCHQP